jgi:hypothetical protein
MVVQKRRFAIISALPFSGGKGRVYHLIVVNFGFNVVHSLLIQYVYTKIKIVLANNFAIQREK